MEQNITTTKVLTPIQIWQGYNPTSLPLDVSIVRREVVDGIVREGVYITAEVTALGAVREYLEVYYPEGITEKTPVVMYVPPVEQGLSRDNIYAFVRRGYVFVKVDYIGEGDYHHTMYPEDLDYLVFSRVGDHINRITAHAQDTSWYHWTLLVRRALSYVMTLHYINPAYIMLVGEREGGYIAWQTTAMDGRVTRLVIMEGYIPPKAEDIDEDEHFAWLTGIDARAYSQYINVPIFMVNTLDSGLATDDDVKEITGNLPDITPINYSLSIEPLGAISESDYLSIFSFADCMYNGDLIPKSSIEIVEEGDNLKAIVNYDSQDVLYVKIYKYTDFGDKYGKIKTPTVTKTDRGYEADIDIYFADKPTYIVGKVYTTYGSITTDTIKLELDEGSKFIKPVHGYKAIYNVDNTTSTMNIRPNTMVVGDDCLSVQEGAIGVRGLRTQYGSLIHRRDYEKEDEIDFDATLSANMCNISGDTATIKVIIHVGEYGTASYSAEYTIDNDNKWHTLMMERLNFKDKDNITMSQWNDYYQIEIEGADKVLINSIQWL